MYKIYSKSIHNFLELCRFLLRSLPFMLDLEWPSWNIPYLIIYVHTKFHQNLSIVFGILLCSLLQNCGWTDRQKGGGKEIMMMIVRGERIIFVIPFSLGLFLFCFYLFSSGIFCSFTLYFLLFSAFSYWLFFRWDFVLVRVKQAVRFLQSFYYKNRRGREFIW